MIAETKDANVPESPVEVVVPCTVALCAVRVPVLTVLAVSPVDDAVTAPPIVSDDTLVEPSDA
jgi:hypothetical protein